MERWREFEDSLFQNLLVEERVFQFEETGPVDAANVVIPGSEKSAMIEHYEFRLAPEQQRVDCTYFREGEARPTTVECLNSEYYFAAGRPPGASSWNVYDMHQRTPEELRLDQDSKVWHLLTALSTAAMPLHELVQHPTFRIESVSTDDRGAVVIKYSLHAPDESPGGTVYHGGTLEFKDAQSWLPMAATTDATAPGLTGKIVESWEWADFDGRMVPQRQARVYHVSGEPTLVQVRTFENWKREVFTDADFRLSSLGFPEPVFASSIWREAWFLWALAVTAFALMCTGHLMRRHYSA